VPRQHGLDSQDPDRHCPQEAGPRDGHGLEQDQGKAGENYPVAEHIARQELYLPSGLTLSEAQLDQVCDAVRRVLK
jgi:dTDP-4-amino-4,6-dideoxygalactose transaminase